MTAPDRIYIDRGPNGGWMYRDKRMPDTRHEYVRADLVADLIRDAVEVEMRKKNDLYKG
jgi:hypothetical protein